MGVPTDPLEIGSGFAVGASVYGIAVRDQYSPTDAKIHRFAYLATSNPAKEVMVLDVTNCENSKSTCSISEVTGARTALSGTQEGRSIDIIGNRLYLGRQSVTGGGPDVYVFDVTDPLATTNGLPTLGQVDVARDATSLRVSGPYLFVGTNKNAQELQVLSSNPDSLASVYTRDFNVSNVLETDLDFDNGALYVVQNQDPGSPQLTILNAP